LFDISFIQSQAFHRRILSAGGLLFLKFRCPTCLVASHGLIHPGIKPVY
jgi:hypothetical protein